MKRILLALAVFALVTSACAQFGHLGDIVNKGQKVAQATTPWTPEQEAEIGQAAAAKILHIFPLYNNAPLTEYVNLVGNTVAQYGQRDTVHYHFAILNTPIQWACAMPGGYVFVTRGAVEKMKDEAELAGVLAHEVAHVDGRHLESVIRSKKLTSLAVEEGTSHIPMNVLQNLANNLVTTALTQNYAPDKENEADTNGTKFAANAGYDAAGLKDFLERLATYANDPANQKSTGLWNGHSHPPFGERVKRLDSLLKKYPTGGETLEGRFQKELNPPATTTATDSKTTEKSK